MGTAQYKPKLRWPIKLGHLIFFVLMFAFSQRIYYISIV
jgi:hypothetical protein